MGHGTRTAGWVYSSDMSNFLTVQATPYNSKYSSWIDQWG